MNRARAWLPFKASEVELLLGIAGLGATAASLLGAPGGWVVAGTGIFLFLAFTLGMLAVHAGNRVATVHLDGALHGRGYVSAFGAARHSLLLIHLDDDAPGEELLGLYRSLLGRGVEIRRLVFARRDHHPDGIGWISDFGPQPRLHQRFVETEPGAPLMVSFAIVDEGIVLLAVPGFRPTETEPYSGAVVLRHLIELRHPAITRAFLQVYEAAWRRARPLLLEAVVDD